MTNGNTRVVLIKGGEMETSSEYIMETGPHSPTDSSEDSVEVKVEVITGRSKRKLSEPRRINESLGPLKKRMCIRTDETEPFRPWNSTAKLFAPTDHPASIELTKNYPEPHRYFRPPSPINPTPVDLIVRSKEPEIMCIKQEPDLRVPIHPAHTSSFDETETTLSNSLTAFPKLESRKEQRNYKNMTRERRIEANARERTRVHTISAAFDTLRKSVPAYSHSQKLSKLSVLRIACSYIMTLSNMLDDSPEVIDNVEAVSRTIQREGKLRKKKEDDE